MTSRQVNIQDYPTSNFPNTQPLGNKWNLIEEGTLAKKMKQIQNYRKHGLRTFYVDVDYQLRENPDDDVTRFTVRMPPKVNGFSSNIKMFMSVFNFTFDAEPDNGKFLTNIYVGLSLLKNEVNPYILNVPIYLLTGSGFTLENDSYHIDNISQVTTLEVTLYVPRAGKIDKMTPAEANSLSYNIDSFNMRLRFMVDIEIE